MNVTGTWKGTYTFEDLDPAAQQPDDEESPAPQPPPGTAMPTVSRQVIGNEVAFTLTLKQGWLGNFTGTIKEDERHGFPEEGKIKGRTKGKILDFRKFMPVMRMMHEANRLTLEQFAERRKMVVDTFQPNPPVIYMGDISDDETSVSGTWRMRAATIEVPGSYQQIYLPPLGGSWKMSRA